MSAELEVRFNGNQVRCYSSTDRKFLETIELWLRERSEVLVMIRYTRAGGNTSFEFFTSFPKLAERVSRLGPSTWITVFREPQLRIRGVVDDELIDRCLRNIADGHEFLVAETVCRTAGEYSWFSNDEGETHQELRESLEESRGRPVAVGEYPPWLEDRADVITAIVPDERGEVRLGVY